MPKPDGQQFIHLLGENDVKYEFKKLFHGTRTPIPEGEDILPIRVRNPESTTPKGHITHATPSLAVAKNFSRDKETRELGYVYQVEPLNTEDLNSTWVRPMKNYTPKSLEVVSRHGFRIVKQIHPK